MSDTLLALTEADADLLRDMLRVQRNMRGVAHNSVVGICVAQPEVASRAGPTSPRRTVGELFAVLVEKDGGADGNATTAATYTYTVRSLAGTTLGTAVAQARPRSLGKVTYQTGMAGYGIAFMVDGVLVLWDAGEVPLTGACA